MRHRRSFSATDVCTTAASDERTEPDLPVGGGTRGLDAKKTKARESKVAKICQRVVMSLLMIGSFLCVIWLGHPFLVALVVIIQVGCFKELVAVRYIPAAERKAPLFRTMQWSAFWVCMLHSYGKSISKLGLKVPGPLGIVLRDVVRYRSFIVLAGYVAIFVTFVMTLRKDILKYQIGNIIWTAGVLGLTVIQVSGTITLIFRGIFWFIVPCGLVVANDCFAYICGMSMGRKFTSATFLSISPNKTWEGFIGAIFCTMAFAWVFAGIIANIPWLTCPQSNLTVLPSPLECEPPPSFVRKSIPVGLDDYVLFTVDAKPAQLHSLSLAGFASFVAPFGGFLASGIKRAYDIKDFGGLIPGHGGFMDRMDCQLMMLLCTFVYYQTFVEDPFASEENILTLVRHLSRESQLRIKRSLDSMLQDA